MKKAIKEELEELAVTCRCGQPAKFDRKIDYRIYNFKCENCGAVLQVRIE